MIDLEFELQPKQKLFQESVEQNPVTLYGGAKGGGKSRGLRDIFLLRRFQYAKTHGVIFRRTYEELEGNHIRKMFEERPALREYWHDSKKILSLPNGSTLQFRHCASEPDALLYQGREFHDLGIDEAGQWTEAMFRAVHGSNRSTIPGIKSRCALTANPGGVGHSWLKRLFVEKRFNERERSQDYHFIQALVDDNPALILNDPDYVHKLNAEPNEALRRAYRYGDWDIFAGQYFGELSRDVHFIRPFDIPSHWIRFGAYDFGFNHPAAFGWFVTDEDGNVYQYRELVQAGLRVDQFAEKLKEFNDTKDLIYIVAGHDCWAERSNTINKDQGKNPPTIAKEFSDNDIHLKQAEISRKQGAAHLRKYLSWRNKYKNDDGKVIDGKPRLFFFNNCTYTFDCLTRMEHNPSDVEDVLKVDAVAGDPMTGDDAYDMVRYGMMSRPVISDPVPIRKPGTPEYDKKMAEDMFKHTQEKLQREKEIKDGQGMNWQTDDNGIPKWSRWDE